MKINMSDLFERGDYFDIMIALKWHPKTAREHMHFVESILSNPEKSFAPFFDGITSCCCGIELKKIKCPAYPDWREEEFYVDRRNGFWLSKTAQITGDSPISLIQWIFDIPINAEEIAGLFKEALREKRPDNIVFLSL